MLFDEADDGVLKFGVPRSFSHRSAERLQRSSEYIAPGNSTVWHVFLCINSAEPPKILSCGQKFSQKGPEDSITVTIQPFKKLLYDYDYSTLLGDITCIPRIIVSLPITRDFHGCQTPTRPVKLQKHSFHPILQSNTASSQCRSSTSSSPCPCSSSASRVAP